MNTEEIRKKFKDFCNTEAASKVRAMFIRGDDKKAHSALYREGYQQAVKDVENPLIEYIESQMHIQNGEPCGDVVDCIKEFFKHE
jgi:hypothetical protein